MRFKMRSIFNVLDRAGSYLSDLSALASLSRSVDYLDLGRLMATQCAWHKYWELGTSYCDHEARLLVLSLMFT